MRSLIAKHIVQRLSLKRVRQIEIRPRVPGPVFIVSRGDLAQSQPVSNAVILSFIVAHYQMV